MHPNLFRIPSCAQQQQGYADPPNVGLHIDLYALAVSLVEDCFLTIGKRDMSRVFVAAIAFGRFEDFGNPSFRLGDPGLGGKLPYDKRDPNLHENCSLQDRGRSSIAEMWNSRRGPDPACICYNGFEQARITQLFQIGADHEDGFGRLSSRPVKILGKPEWEGLGEFVAGCLDFTAMLVPIPDENGRPGSLGEKLAYQRVSGDDGLAPFAVPKAGAQEPGQEAVAQRDAEQQKQEGRPTFLPPQAKVHLSKAHEAADPGPGAKDDSDAVQLHQEDGRGRGDSPGADAAAPDATLSA
eukprot:GSA25T00024101001.1